MARPREFDEAAVLDAAVECFWSKGYEATSVRDLIDGTGLTSASLYNAFGDKRALYHRALDRYVEISIAERIARCRALPPREAIDTFFAEIVARSLNDAQQKGCMLVNAAFDVEPNDPGFREAVKGVLGRIEAFFLACVREGQADGSIASSLAAEDLARHLLSVHVGVRLLARVRPERDLLEGAVSAARALLDRR